MLLSIIIKLEIKLKYTLKFVDVQNERRHKNENSRLESC